MNRSHLDSCMKLSVMRTALCGSSKVDGQSLVLYMACQERAVLGSLQSECCALCLHGGYQASLTRCIYSILSSVTMLCRATCCRTPCLSQCAWRGLRWPTRQGCPCRCPCTCSRPSSRRRTLPPQVRDLICANFPCTPPQLKLYGASSTAMLEAACIFSCGSACSQSRQRAANHCLACRHVPGNRIAQVTLAGV